MLIDEFGKSSSGVQMRGAGLPSARGGWNVGHGVRARRLQRLGCGHQPALYDYHQKSCADFLVVIPAIL
jgi:hypothetical protein